MTDSTHIPARARSAGLIRWLTVALRRSLRRFRTATQGRSRRVFLLLVLLWLLNGFDLLFTIMAGDLPHFNEANPIAAGMFDHPYALIAFKVGAVAFASTILILFRRHRTAELACWCVCTVYMALSFLWMWFFIRYEGMTQPWPT